MYVANNIDGEPKVKLLSNVKSNEMILDIGPDTVKK